MKKSISIILILLFAISPLSYAGQKTKKKKTKAIPEIEFTVAQIDVSLDKLPPKYLGNDPRKVYSAIEGRKKVGEKGEFETTEQFTKRVDENNRLPVIGKIGLDGFFAFRATSDSIKVNYNADTAKFTVDVKIEPDFRRLGYGVTSPYKSIIIFDEKAEQSEYIGGNAFGATTTVTSNSYNSHGLLFNNYEKFYSPRLSDEAIRREARTEASYTKYNMKFTPNYSDYDKVYELNATVNATNEEAKTIKGQIAAMVVVKLKEPFIAVGSIYIPATFDSASSFSHEFKYLFADVQEIWIYNIKTGEIYAKKKL